MRLGIIKKIWAYRDYTILMRDVSNKKNSNLDAFTFLVCYMVQVGTDTPHLTQQICAGWSSTCWTLCQSEVSMCVCVCVCVVNHTCTYKAVQLKSKLQTILLPALSPSSIFPPPSYHCPFIPTQKSLAYISKTLSHLLYFFKIVYTGECL